MRIFGGVTILIADSKAQIDHLIKYVTTCICSDIVGSKTPVNYTVYFKYLFFIFVLFYIFFSQIYLLFIYITIPNPSESKGLFFMTSKILLSEWDITLEVGDIWDNPVDNSMDNNYSGAKIAGIRRFDMVFRIHLEQYRTGESAHNLHPKKHQRKMPGVLNLDVALGTPKELKIHQSGFKFTGWRFQAFLIFNPAWGNDRI